MECFKDECITSGGSLYTGGTTQAQGAAQDSWDYDENEAYYARSAYNSTTSTTPALQGDTNGFGITHEKGIGFTTPIDAKCQFFSGKRDQKAADMLLSNVDNFKVGNEYYHNASLIFYKCHTEVFSKK